MRLACASLAFLLAVPAPAKEKAPPATESPIVTLVPYRVSGRAVGNFAVAIQVLHDPTLKKTRLVIIDVTQRSDAEKAGLQAGDEIVKIGGALVEDMDPRVTKDTALGKIFLNRVYGDTIDLEVVTRRTKLVTLRTAG